MTTPAPLQFNIVLLVGGLNVLLAFSGFVMCLFGWCRFRSNALFCLCLGLFFGFLHECLGFFDVSVIKFYLRAFFTLSFFLIAFGFAYDLWPKGRYLDRIIVITSLFWTGAFLAGLCAEIGLLKWGFHEPISEVCFTKSPALFALVFIFFTLFKKAKYRAFLVGCFAWWLVIPLFQTAVTQRFLSFPYYSFLLAAIWVRGSLGIAQMIENVKALTAEKEVTLSFLQVLGDAAQDALNLDRSLELIMDFVLRTTKAHGGTIYLLSESRDTLRPAVALGLFPPLHYVIPSGVTKQKQLQDKVATETLKLEDGLLGEVARLAEPQLIRDARKDHRIVIQEDAFIRVRSIMVVPLCVRGEVLGVMAVANLQGEGEREFGFYDMAILQALGDQASVYINNARIHELMSVNQRMERDLELAKEIQRFLLPASFPSFPGIELAGFSRPSQEVGGDYYDFVLIDNRHLGIAIGDVSGKGVPGALMMALTRSVLRAEGSNSLSPGDVLRRANMVICDDIKEGMFVSLIYGILDLEKKALTFARAGHTPLILSRKGQTCPELLAPEGISIGLDRGALFISTLEEQVVDLRPGDVCLMFTDGVDEAESKEGEEFGMDRLVDLVARHSDDSPSGLIKAIDDAVKAFSGDGVPRDDITLLAIKIL